MSQIYTASQDSEFEQKRLEDEGVDYTTLILEGNETLADLRNYWTECKEKLSKKEANVGMEKLRMDFESKIQTLNEKVKTNGSGKTTPTTSKYETHVKLPRLNFPKFDGNILKWQEFWDSFTAGIHENESLKPIDKFNYLKAQLVGEARDALSGLELTNANYDIAVKMLEERFGRKQVVITAHYTALMDIKPILNNMI